MIVVMAVSLYTVRAILDILGVVDYGIYNAVGGVVGMFAFINGTLTTSSQRYFSIELAKGDLKRLNEWFCLNISAFSILILAIFVIAETVGLWFVNYKMTIPPDRLLAANVVYQLSILSICFDLLAIPYNALIIAHEKMSAFAYISIVEAGLKLVIVFLLSVLTYDKLIIYGVLMFMTSAGIASSYIIYNHIKFVESKYKFYWNKNELKELLGFSGWHFYGTFSVVIRSQGINLLINTFFNPAVNGARAIAFQIYNAVSQLSNNFFVAVKPQIYKSYAVNDYAALYKLILRSTIICSLLVSILIFPILANTDYILGLWLKEVPDYAVIFTQLVLINGLIDATNGPTTATVLATGKIRNYELIVATLFLLNLPISYIALKFGADPTATMIISIIISLIVTFARAYIMSRKIKTSFLGYTKMFSRLIVSSGIICGIIYFVFYNSAQSFVSLLWLSLLIIILTIGVYTLIAFKKNDIILFVQFIKKRISK